MFKKLLFILTSLVSFVYGDIVCQSSTSNTGGSNTTTGTTQGKLKPLDILLAIDASDDSMGTKIQPIIDNVVGFVTELLSNTAGLDVKVAVLSYAQQASLSTGFDVRLKSRIKTKFRIILATSFRL